MNNTLNILFLGASKRTSLLENFEKSALKLGINLKMFSCEKNTEFCAISHLATILSGPKFADDAFQDWLAENILKYNINIVIPNMDSATVALAKFKENHKDLKNCWCVVSSFELCEKMNDKQLSEKFFNEHNIPTFENTDGVFPKILKDKLGFGGKGQFIVNNKSEYDDLLKRIDKDNYVIQDYIKGRETSVDFYVSPFKSLMGYVLRDRLEVSDGEVMNCITRYPEVAEKNLIENIAKINGWEGCITLQYIKDENGNIRVVEINPRFGGGATCAIACGLDMPTFVLSEFIGVDFAVDKIKNLRMARSRRDFFIET